MKDLSISGHTVLITGTAQGIEKDIVHALLDNSAAVIAAEVNEERLNKFEFEATEKRFGSRFHFCQVDVSEVSDLLAVVVYAEEHLGGIDIVVNNAGLIDGSESLQPMGL